MLKRCLAAILSLFVLCSCALAQEDVVANYRMPEGAEVFYLPMGEKPEAPVGLENMYALMQPSRYNGDLYLLKMKNGQVLFSISSMAAERKLTATELVNRWPQVVSELLRTDLIYPMTADEGHAQVEKLGGMEMLHGSIQLSLNDGMSIVAEGYAFCLDSSVTEMWAVYPDPELYGDTPRGKELNEDLADLQILLDSLVFPGGTTKVLSSEEYADEKGRFHMMIPSGSLVLTADTHREDVFEIETRFVQKNPIGAQRVFDRFMSQLENVDSTLIFTPDMQGIIRVTATPEQCLTGVQPEGLATLAPTFQEVFEKDFDLSFCMEDDARIQISGEEHALMGYWLRMGELDLQLDLMLCIHPESWMYEVDIYTAEGDQNLRAELFAFVEQTLVYTPPVNALE